MDHEDNNTDGGLLKFTKMLYQCERAGRDGRAVTPTVLLAQLLPHVSEVVPAATLGERGVHGRNGIWEVPGRHREAFHCLLAAHEILPEGLRTTVQNLHSLARERYRYPYKVRTLRKLIRNHYSG